MVLAIGRRLFAALPAMTDPSLASIRIQALASKLGGRGGGGRSAGSPTRMVVSAIAIATRMRPPPRLRPDSRHCQRNAIR